TNPDSKPQATPARAEITAAKAISTEKLVQQLPEPESATEEPAGEAEIAPSNREALQTKGATRSTQLPNGESKPTATLPTAPDPGIKNRVQTTAPAATSVDATQKVNAAVTAANEPTSKLATGLPSKTEATLTVDKNGAPVVQAIADATKEQPIAPKATTTKVERQPILQRMAALLHASPTSAEQASVSTLDPAPPPLIPNRMSLGSFVHEIHLHLAGRQLPDPLKPALKNLVDALAQPLTQPDAVEQWFDFLRQPLSSDSTAGRALQQWALTLLSIRLQQMAVTTDPTSSAQQQPHPLLNHEEHQQLTHKLAASLFGQTERFQQLQQDAQQQIPNYVPLPPQQPGDREGGLSMQRSAGKQSPYQWTLSFFIELPQLGPLQIRACLDIPDIQLQVMAERLSAVDKIKETLPLLEGRFRELGLTPGGFVCRQGKIIPPQTEDETSSASATAGFSIRI
ncbi:flagellar hook-length control protein FliK, partial [Pseudaeromonas pectinilytica]